MKMVLCAFLVFGLVPGSDELVETLTHLAQDGHLPHSQTHDRVAAFERHPTDAEHGCTPVDHHCKCCATQHVVPPKAGPPALPAFANVALRYARMQGRGPPSRSTAPPVPPPIA
jgi:hypothetical protein